MIFGKINKPLLVSALHIIVLVFSSCIEAPSTEKEDIKFRKKKKVLQVIPEKLHDLMKQKAELYIKEMRKKLDTPLYVNVLLKKENKETYEFSIYVFDKLLKDDQIPYDFSIFNYNGKNVIYFYNESETNTNKEHVLKKLKQNNLIKDDNIVLASENTNRLNDFIAWNCFVCKVDINKINIIKSPYVLEEKEKPNNVCK
ncbi:hypothetical protein ACFSTE_10435 [Aquimarina hainanensis]|uniref:Lipoprotein n=1 Tax=Aquimarina hainanensis TaxID=1578017 RepID=A0ABW5N8V0_9FLAO